MPLSQLLVIRPSVTHLNCRVYVGLVATSIAVFDAFDRCAGNIRVQQWLPQQDLLGHPAVKLFLSHGGIHSMYEARWHSKPMVLVPIATDQFDNAR